MSGAIQIKIFLGYIENSELKMHLSQSNEWNRAKILAENQLIEVRREEKDYIGLFIEPPCHYDFIKKKKQRSNLSCNFIALNLK